MSQKMQIRDPLPAGLQSSSQSSDNPRQPWSIILAGGNGDRISELIHTWMGRHIPKQYCAFTGSRSMLQLTLTRSENLSPRDRQLILIAKSHQPIAEEQLAGYGPNRIIVQPANRDTLPGIYLPLTHLYARDSKATVAIYPSDHFIYPENKFRRVMEYAIQAVEEMPDRIVLIGAQAAFPEPDYGWICPGREIWKSEECRMHAVDLFMEKPSEIDAARIMARGGMWNTMIVVAKAGTLWQLGCAYYPEILKHFERMLSVIGTSHEKDVLEEIYEVMPSGNFSSGLLTQAISQIGVIPMKDVFWCDWGRKERIIESLQFLGKEPNFPISAATKDSQDAIGMETLSLPPDVDAAVAEIRIA